MVLSLVLTIAGATAGEAIGGYTAAKATKKACDRLLPSRKKVKDIPVEELAGDPDIPDDDEE